MPGGRIPMHLPRRPQRDPPAQQPSHAPNTGQWHLHRAPGVCASPPQKASSTRQVPHWHTVGTQ